MDLETKLLASDLDRILSDLQHIATTAEDLSENAAVHGYGRAYDDSNHLKHATARLLKDVRTFQERWKSRH